MKRIMNIAATVALLFGAATTAAAQSVEDSYPYNFITVQGGAQATLTHYKFTDLITPQVALSYGRYFNSKVGARIHVQGWEIKSGFKADRHPFVAEDTKYKFKAITGDIDLLMNMTNIISPNRSCDRFDWVLLAGFGVNYAWDFDEYNCIIPQSNANNYYLGPEMCGTKHSTFNSRLGTQLNYNISRAIAVGLELDANMKNDEFNLKRNYDPDFQLQALLGLTFKFGGPKKAAVAPVAPPVPVKVEEPKDEPKAVFKEEPKPEPKPQPVVKDEPLNETFFYSIRLSDPEPDAKLNKIVAWCKKYPQKKVTVKGYADKGTGNPKINIGYAKVRAEKVANALKAKGVPASQLEVTSYGDTVQPFPNNDNNRCVIVVGE